MSYQVGNACYGTDIAAAQAVASGLVGSLHQSGGYLYALDVVGVSGESISVTFSALDGGPALAGSAIPLTLQPCNLLDTGDGVQIGWLLIAAWAAAYSLRWLGSVLENWWEGGSDGDA